MKKYILSTLFFSVLSVIIFNKIDVVASDVIDKKSTIIQDLKQGHLARQSNWLDLTKEILRKYNLESNDIIDNQIILSILNDISKKDSHAPMALGSMLPDIGENNSYDINKLLSPIDLIKVDNLSNDNVISILGAILHYGLSFHPANKKTNPYDSYKDLYYGTDFKGDSLLYIAKVFLNRVDEDQNDNANLLCIKNDNRNPCIGVYPFHGIRRNNDGLIMTLWGKDLKLQDLGRSSGYRNKISQDLLKKMLDKFFTHYADEVNRNTEYTMNQLLLPLLSAQGQKNDLKDSRDSILKSFLPSTGFVNMGRDNSCPIELILSMLEFNNYNMNNLSNDLAVISSIYHPDNWEKTNNQHRGNTISNVANKVKNKQLLFDILIEGGLREKIKNIDENNFSGISTLKAFYNIHHKNGTLSKYIKPFGESSNDYSEIADAVLFNLHKDDLNVDYAIFNNASSTKNRNKDNFIKPLFGKEKFSSYQELLSIASDDQSLLVDVNNDVDNNGNTFFWSLISKYLKSIIVDDQSSIDDILKQKEYNNKIPRLRVPSKDLGFLPVLDKDNTHVLLKDFVGKQKLDQIHDKHNIGLKQALGKSFIDNLHLIDPTQKGVIRKFDNGDTASNKNSMLFQLADVLKPYSLPTKTDGTDDEKKYRDLLIKEIISFDNANSIGKILTNNIIQKLYSTIEGDADTLRYSILDLFNKSDVTKCNKLSECAIFNPSPTLIISNHEGNNNGHPNFINYWSVVLIETYLNNAFQEKDLWTVYGILPETKDTTGSIETTSLWVMPVGFDGFKGNDVENIFFHSKNSAPVISSIINYLQRNPKVAAKLVKPIDVTQNGEHNIYQITGKMSSNKGKSKNNYFKSEDNGVSYTEESAVVTLEVAALRFMELLSEHGKYGSNGVRSIVPSAPEDHRFTILDDTESWSSSVPPGSLSSVLPAPRTTTHTTNGDMETIPITEEEIAAAENGLNSENALDHVTSESNTLNSLSAITGSETTPAGRVNSTEHTAESNNNASNLLPDSSSISNLEAGSSTSTGSGPASSNAITPEEPSTTSSSNAENTTTANGQTEPNNTASTGGSATSTESATLPEGSSDTTAPASNASAVASTDENARLKRNTPPTGTLPHSDYNEGTLFKLPYGNEYIFGNRLLHENQIIKHADKIVEKYHALSSKNDFNTMFFGDSSKEGISILEVVKDAIFNRMPFDDLKTSKANSIYDIIKDLKDKPSSSNKLFDNDNGDKECQSIASRTKGCKIKIYNTIITGSTNSGETTTGNGQGDQFKTYLSYYPWSINGDKKDKNSILDIVVRKIRNHEDLFSNFSVNMRPYLKELVLDVSKNTNNGSEANVAHTIDFMEEPFRLTKLDNNKYETIVDIFTDMFKSKTGLENLAKAYGDNIVQLLIHREGRSQENYSYPKMITELEVKDWIDIAKNIKGFLIKDKNSASTSLFTARSIESSVLDFIISKDKDSKESIRDKLSYYGTNNRYFGFDLNRFAKDSDLAKFSQNQFKQLLISEISNKNPKNISNLIEWIKDNATIQHKLKDMKIGVSKDKSKNEFFQLSVMNDPDLSPYMVKFVNELLEDKKITSIMEKYSPSQALIKMFNNLGSGSSEMSIILSDKVADLTSIAKILKVSIDDLLNIFNQSLIDGIVHEFNGNNLPKSYATHSFYHIFDKQKLHAFGNKYAFPSENEDHTTLDGDQSISKYIVYTLENLIKQVSDDSELINELYQNHVFHKALEAINSIKIDNDPNSIFSYLSNKDKGVINSKFDILNNGIIDRKNNLYELFQYDINHTIIRDAVRNLGFLKIDFNDDIKLSTWATTEDAKRYLLENADKFAEVLVNDKSADKNIGFRDILIEHINISDTLAIWNKISDYIAKNDTWFNSNDLIFKTGDPGHLIGSKTIEHYLSKGINESDDDSDSTKQLERFSKLFDHAKIRWMLVSTKHSPVDSEDGTLYFVDENGNNADQLGNGKKIVFDMLTGDRPIKTSDGKIVNSSDFLERSVVKNNAFVKKMIKNGSSVGLNNFIFAQLDKADLTNSTYQHFQNLIKSKIDEIENYDKLKLQVEPGKHIMLKDLFDVTSQVADNPDQVHEVDSDIISILDDYIGLDWSNHDMFKTIDGKIKIMKSLDYDAINDMIAKIVSSRADDAKFSKYIFDVLRDETHDDIVFDFNKDDFYELLAKDDFYGLVINPQRSKRALDEIRKPGRIDSISIGNLFRYDRFKDLSSEDKHSFIKKIMELSLIKSGILISELEQNINNLYLIDHIISKLSLDSIMQYNHVNYGVKASLNYLFNGHHNTYIPSLFANISYNSAFISNLGLHMIYGNYYNINQDNMQSSHIGFAVNMHNRLDHMIDAFNIYASNYINYVRTYNDFNNSLGRSHINFISDSIVIGGTFGLTHYNVENESNHSILIDGKYRNHDLSDEKIDMSNFNIKHAFDLQVRLVGNYAINLNFNEDSKIKLNFNLGSGAEVLSNQFIFDAGIFLGLHFNHYFNADINFGVHKYLHNDWNYKLEIGLELKI